MVTPTSHTLTPTVSLSLLRLRFAAQGTPPLPEHTVAALLGEVLASEALRSHRGPLRASHFTVMRSPHVFAKSKENFGQRIQGLVVEGTLAASSPSRSGSRSRSRGRAEARRIYGLLVQLFPTLHWTLERTVVHEPGAGVGPGPGPGA